MIVGSGIDLCSIARMQKALLRHPSLPARVLSRYELDAVGGVDKVNANLLAKRFAAKEALIKAMGGSNGLAFTDTSVAHDSKGKPEFVSSVKLQLKLGEGVRVHLSLSDEKTHVVAMVILER